MNSMQRAAILSRFRWGRRASRHSRLRPTIFPVPKRTLPERLELIFASRHIRQRADDHIRQQRIEESQAAQLLAKELMELALADLTPKEIGDLLLQAYASHQYSNGP